jgi:tRNA threonylcarbamoyladenosine biosynthesis protein TsaE
MEKMLITEVSELEAVAERVLEILTTQNNIGLACVLALHGDLGAGKTTFTQTLARLLGVEEIVTSPTFVVMKGYELSNQPFGKLIHIDAYRIEEIDEMRVLGFEALLTEKGTIMCIEWAENIKSLLPENTIHIRFELDGEKRIITIEHNNYYGS